MRRALKSDCRVAILGLSSLISSLVLRSPRRPRPWRQESEHARADSVVLWLGTSFRLLDAPRRSHIAPDITLSGALHEPFRSAGTPTEGRRYPLCMVGSRPETVKVRGTI